VKRVSLPARLRAELWERSAGVCEACGYWMHREEMQAHHRKLRSQGGLDDLTNLLAVHPSCHTGPHGIHMNPARSYDLGHLVRSYHDPADVAVEPLPAMCPLAVATRKGS
jgi:hypothetical protein